MLKCFRRDDVGENDEFDRGSFASYQTFNSEVDFELPPGSGYATPGTCRNCGANLPPCTIGGYAPKCNCSPSTTPPMYQSRSIPDLSSNELCCIRCRNCGRHVRLAFHKVNMKSTIAIVMFTIFGVGFGVALMLTGLMSKIKLLALFWFGLLAIIVTALFDASLCRQQVQRNRQFNYIPFEESYA